MLPCIPGSTRGSGRCGGGTCLLHFSSPPPCTAPLASHPSCCEKKHAFLLPTTPYATVCTPFGSSGQTAPSLRYRKSPVPQNKNRFVGVPRWLTVKNTLTQCQLTYHKVFDTHCDAALIDAALGVTHPTCHAPWRGERRRVASQSRVTSQQWRHTAGTETPETLMSFLHHSTHHTTRVSTLRQGGRVHTVCVVRCDLHM